MEKKNIVLLALLRWRERHHSLIESLLSTDGSVGTEQVINGLSNLLTELTTALLLPAEASVSHPARVLSGEPAPVPAGDSAPVPACAKNTETFAVEERSATATAYTVAMPIFSIPTSTRSVTDPHNALPGKEETAGKQPLSAQKPVDDPKKEAVCEEETTLYIVRHGETEENVMNILQGHLPGHLTEHGREQARALRDKLADRHFDALMCSDLQRCVDTARILNEPHGLPLGLTPLLRERDWGNLTGISYLKARQQLNNTVESVDALFARAERFLQTLVEQHAGQTVLAVSHGLFSRVVQGAASGKTLREVPRMDNAEVRVVRLKPPLAFRYLKEESGLTAD